ncbi:MAG: hypothetical protein M5U28_03475 [Sandaracinaceae bacterium]|nr:hypothetical protein [Sandaracinaceae bacterium]
MVATSPEIGLAHGTGPAIAARLIAADPRAGDTPTPDAFATVRSYLASTPTTRPRFVVLMTDGLPEPNCGATVPATVAAIADLRTSLGVETFVVGIVGPDSTGSMAGIPALRDALNMMADAGGRPRSGTLRYYEGGRRTRPHALAPRHPRGGHRLRGEPLGRALAPAPGRGAAERRARPDERLDADRTAARVHRRVVRRHPLRQRDAHLRARHLHVSVTGGAAPPSAGRTRRRRAPRRACPG